MSTMADELMADGAAFLEEVERVWIANDNRLKTILRRGADPENHDVIVFRDMVATLESVVGLATDQLERHMLKQHALGGWVKNTTGVGAKQAARLLAEIGDPYWHPLEDRPRTFGELAAYCGIHVENGMAPRREKGVQGRWNSKARMRLWLIATKVIMYDGALDKNGKSRPRSPYRDVYDAAREKYADATHDYMCTLCKNKAVGAPLAAGHQHKRAIILVMREILRDLYEESKKLHEENLVGIG